MLKRSQIIVALIHKFSDDFKNTLLTNISTVQVFEVIVFADVPIKLDWNAFSQQHIDHALVCLKLFVVERMDLGF